MARRCSGRRLRLKTRVSRISTEPLDFDEVYVTRLGSAVVLIPKGDSWSVLFDSLAGFSDDFLARREQPVRQQERDLDL